MKKYQPKPLTYDQRLRRLRAQYRELETAIDLFLKEVEKEPENPLNSLISRSEAAAMLGVCTRELCRIVKEHPIRKFRVDNRYIMYRRVDIAAIQQIRLTCK